MSVTAWHFWYCNNYIQWIFVLVSRKIIDIYEFIHRHLLLASLQNLFPANTRVGIWRITEATTTARRRLLASTYVYKVVLVISCSFKFKLDLKSIEPFF